MKNSIKTVLLVCMCILILSGCSLGKPEPTQAPAPPAVTELSCVSPRYLPQMTSLSDTDLLLSWEENGMTWLTVVDTNADAVKLKGGIPGSWSVSSQQFPDEAIALYSMDTHAWIFLDSSLNQLQQWPCDEAWGVFSQDRSIYYVLRDRALWEVSTATGETFCLQLAPNLHFADIQSVSPDGRYLALSFELSPFLDGCGTAILDVKMGQFLSVRDERTLPRFTATGVAMMDYSEADAGYGVRWGTWGSGSFLRTEASEFPAGEDVFSVEGSSCLIGAAENSTLYLLGENGITACDLAYAGALGEIRTVCAMQNSSVLAAASYFDGAAHIYMVDPTLLTANTSLQAVTVQSPLFVDTAVAEGYGSALKGEQLPQNLQDVRAFADRIEKKYGVTFYLSDQCGSLQQLCPQTFRTTAELANFNESEKLTRVLEAIDRSLALFPNGFFFQMQDSTGFGGVRFLLTGPISDGFAGYTTGQGEWQTVTLDCTQQKMESIVCHELWHAIENKIVAQEPDALEPNLWAACNPEGFSYTNDRSNTDPDQYRWTMFYSSASDTYFVDPYARQNEHEDRARIMEYLLATDAEARVMMSCPAMQKKAALICEAIRRNFDTASWENVRWERFRSNAG